MGQLGTWGCRACQALESLRQSLAVLYWETAMFLSLVANAGLSGVTCALYPLERSLMLVPLRHLDTSLYRLLDISKVASSTDHGQQEPSP